MIDFLILLLISIAESRWQPHTYYARDVPVAPGEKPAKYFTRWFFIGGPETEGMENGMSKGWGLYLHCFHRSDDSVRMHSHPWRWAVSLVLKNGYVEHRLEGAPPPDPRHLKLSGVEVYPTPWRKEVRPGMLNFLRGTTFHRVELDRGEAWTLFLVGPGIQSWGFLDLATRKFTDWKEFSRMTHAQEQ